MKGRILAIGLILAMVLAGVAAGPLEVRAEGRANGARATVATGTRHSLAIQPDGSLWAWGWNEGGQPGDGTTTNRHTPVRVMDSAMLPGGVAAMPAPGDGVTLRFYHDPDALITGYYADLEVTESTFFGGDWLQQVAADISADNIWYEGHRIYVDFSEEVSWRFNAGSTGGFLATQSLILNLASFPNVEEMVILVEGQRDVWADHFSFEGIFVVVDSGAERIWAGYDLSGNYVTGRIGRVMDIAPQTVTATPTASTVLVNGQNTPFQAFNIDGSNYFRLRDIAYALNGTSAQFSVGWDGVAGVITLTAGRPYTPIGSEMALAATGAVTATATDSEIILNGSSISPTAFNIDGSNFFMLRDLGAALGFDVDWDGGANTISITTP
ncbi:MAG: GerMN domain-containing protein [Clostridiales bacterium]|jgi:hypothetical protein|nr:GerMN domain-containing protein [Clostridiales bacterium]